VARGAGAFVAVWAALTALWLLAVGAFDRTDVVAGVLAGAVAATAALLVGRERLAPFDFRAGWLLELRSVPWRVLRDSVVVLAALVRRVRGAWDERPVTNARPAGRRAFLAWLGSLGPNTVVVDVDAERGVELVHSLDAKRAS
jgi:multisubunit Na+/H+ antiporter MnhE subunit